MKLKKNFKLNWIKIILGIIIVFSVIRIFTDILGFTYLKLLSNEGIRKKYCEKYIPKQYRGELKIGFLDYHKIFDNGGIIIKDYNDFKTYDMSIYDLYSIDSKIDKGKFDKSFFDNNDLIIIEEGIAININMHGPLKPLRFDYLSNIKIESGIITFKEDFLGFFGYPIKVMDRWFSNVYIIPVDKKYEINTVDFKNYKEPYKEPKYLKCCNILTLIIMVSIFFGGIRICILKSKEIILIKDEEERKKQKVILLKKSITLVIVEILWIILEYQRVAAN